MATSLQSGGWKGWNVSQESAWERVKEAIRRDWEQTLYDLQIEGGHELNQGLADTIKQAAGRQPIPRRNQPNPRNGLRDWGAVDEPIGYGARPAEDPEQAARYEDIETTLRSEWPGGNRKLVDRWGVPRGDEHERRG